MRLVQRRGRRPAEPDLQDAAVGLRPRAADHRRADAGLPADPRPGDRRLVELRGQQDHRAVHAAGRQAAGGVALAAAGHRAGPGIPQVHRVLPVPGRLPRPAQPRDRQAVHGAAVPRPGGRPRDAPDRPGGPAAVPQGRRRHRLLQHHQVLHRGLPGAHQDHRQRDHPAQGAGRRRVLRPAEDGVAVPARRLLVIGRRQGAAGAAVRSGRGGSRDGRRRRRRRRRSPRVSRRPSPRASRRRPRRTPPPARPRVPPDLARPHRRPGRPADPLDRRRDRRAATDRGRGRSRGVRARPRRAGRRVPPPPHPHRRRGPRQPGTGLVRARRSTTSRGPTPATTRPIRTRRSRPISASRPTTSPSTPGSSARSSSAASSGRARSTCSSIRSSSSSSSPAAGGSRTRS